jgi:hypothetical protein
MSPDEPHGEDLNLGLLRLSGAERLDAVLESPHLTDRQATEALGRVWDDGTAAMPQVLIWKVYLSAYGEHPETWAPNYIGPFVNRRAAEEWAAANLPIGDEVTVETAPDGDAHNVGREHRACEAST